MSKKNCCQEKFKTMIGGQALIEGIMMRGPKLDAVVTRGKDGLHIETTPRKINKKGSPKNWVFIRGALGFFDAQVTGVKALMRSADLSPEEETKEKPSKFDLWLEKKLGSKRFQNYVIASAVVLGLGMSILIFFLLPMLLGELFSIWVGDGFVKLLLEGLVRILIFIIYMLLMSRMKEMKRVFSYHGAEHKTIRCYEAGLDLTVENVRKQTRKHPRCGTSFLLIVMIISILVFSVMSTGLDMVFPGMETILGPILYKAAMIAYKLMLLPLVVAITYEINRIVGRYDNWFTRILTAPGMWFQNFTTNEPDDGMIKVGIAALQAVLPENEGEDRW